MISWTQLVQFANMYIGLFGWENSNQNLDMHSCINQLEDASDIHTDDKFTLNLVTRQNVGNPLALADKLHWNDSHLQNKSNKRNVRSRGFWCHAALSAV